MIRFLKGAVALLLIAGCAGTRLGFGVYKQQQALVAQAGVHEAGDLQLAAEKTTTARMAKENALIGAELATAQSDQDTITESIARLQAEQEAEVEVEVEVEVLTKILDTQFDGPIHIANDAAHEAVVVASHPDFGFVVLDKGSADLLQNGVTALVHRHETLVGKVRLTHTEANISMASVDPEWRIGEIKVGDRVLIERVVSR